MRIGFIGFGEVSYEMSKGFQKEGIKNIYAFDPLYENEVVQKKAQEVKVTLFSDPQSVAEQNPDVLIVAVPAQHAHTAWKQIKDSLSPTTVYVDVSTSSAFVKQEIGRAHV